MNVVVAARDELVRSGGGVFGPPGGGWARIARVFERVVVIARVRGGGVPVGWPRVDRDGVVVEPVGGDGLAGGVALARTCLRVAADADVAILHAPSPLASALRTALRIVRRPYAVEILDEPGGGFVRRSLARAQLRDEVDGAVASRFVTSDYLQQRFPPRAGTFTVAAPEVELPDELFDAPPAPIRSGDTLDLAFAGGFERTDEGLDLLLSALAFTARPHKLDVAGEGPLRAQLEERATRLGIGQRVAYRGKVPDLRAFLRARDLFVLPARTGVMHAHLLEAMAMRLPCLATRVGAVGELLDPTELVDVDEPAALARAIDELAGDAPRRGLLALANRRRAREFRISEREIRLAAFLKALRAAGAGSS